MLSAMDLGIAHKWFTFTPKSVQWFTLRSS